MSKKQLEKNFDPREAAPRLYDMWEGSGAFQPRAKTSNDGPDDHFSIVIPPPNVTGSLHMGHALNNTLQDILARFHRMRGKRVLWQPGMDHAGIATQMVVERQLAAAGHRSRKDMGREEFISHVWDWKQESGGTITQQLRRLGSSCDWTREKFTLGDPDDPQMADAITKAFVQLYNDGLIYRGKRLVNWDPHFQTAISDLEVENIEVEGHFWHFKYPLEGGETYTYIEKDEDGTVVFEEERDYISIATTRPETMLGDGAVAVHPSDERYAPIVGKMVRLPLADRLIPIITDHYPDPDFGSGAVKITGAHDFNDYQVAMRNDIPMYPLMGTSGEMITSEIMPEKYVGMDRFEARKAVVADIDAQGLLIKVEDKKIMQPLGDRSKVVIEPMLTDQWFVDAEKMAARAKVSVNEGQTQFIPGNWKKTYDNWMNDIQPWCISRQLWWGHRIPAWYDDEGNIYVAETKRDAEKKAGGAALLRDPDVLDTWFSSGLWPFSTLGWPNDTETLKDFYPTSTLVTGFDIIFFWVARMMMLGLHFKDDVPFKDVYIHALVLDEHGKKMSKSEGNVIDPLDLIDGIGIDALVGKRTKNLRQPEKAPKVERQTRKDYPDGFEAYGADALRFTLASMAGMGRNIRLSVDRVAGYRNFGTKLWNAARFAQMNGCASHDGFDPADCAQPINQWMIAKAGEAIGLVSDHLQNCRFNDAADAAYQFTWGVFCDWYLEMCKPVLGGEDGPAKDETRAAAGWALDVILKLLHPFMPFITEEIWQSTDGVRSGNLITAPWPQAITASGGGEIDMLIDIISAIRSVRAEMNVPPSRKAPLIYSDKTMQVFLPGFAANLAQMARVSELQYAAEIPVGCVQLTAGGASFGIPLSDLIDMDAERDRLTKELAKIEAEIEKVDKKLANKNFTERAPAAVVEEQKSRREKFIAEAQSARDALAKLG